MQQLNILNESLKLKKSDYMTITVTNNIISKLQASICFCLLHSVIIFYSALIFSMSKVSEIFRDLFPSPCLLKSFRAIVKVALKLKL